MKLVIAVVNKEDSSTLISKLNKSGFMSTKLSTTGGFLMVGNTTFLIGAEDNTVAKAKEIIKAHSRKRTSVTSTTTGFGTGLREDDFASEIPVGGAIVFTLDVEDVDKY